MPNENLPRRDVLMIDGYSFPCRPKSDDKRPEVAKEEDLHFAAKDTLEDLRKHRIYQHFYEQYGIDNWQAWLMFLLGRVAKHYGVDKEQLWQLYSKHYGQSLVFEFMEREKKVNGG